MQYIASRPLSGMGTGMAVVGAYVLAGELAEADGDYRVALSNMKSGCEILCGSAQGIEEGSTDWFVPRTRFRLWLSTQMWKVLPYAP